MVLQDLSLSVVVACVVVEKSAHTLHALQMELHLLLMMIVLAGCCQDCCHHLKTWWSWFGTWPCRHFEMDSFGKMVILLRVTVRLEIMMFEYFYKDIFFEGVIM